MKCAVGALIDDDHYEERFEHTTARDGFIVAAVLESYDVDDEDEPDGIVGFLGDLQDVHDDEPAEEWKAALTSLAESYGLGTEVL